MNKIEDLEIENLKIIQDDAYFCFGIDSVLLSDFVIAKKIDKIIDIGCGNGILPLLLHGKNKGGKIIGVEIQVELAELASKNVRLNNLEGKIQIINSAIQDLHHLKADVIVTNPPYMKVDAGIKNSDSHNCIARFEIKLDLNELFASIKKILKEKGDVFMVHRADRIVDIFEVARKFKIEPKEIRFVKSYSDKNAKLILIHFIKGAGKFLKIMPDLIIYNKDGTYTKEVLKIYGKI